MHSHLQKMLLISLLGLSVSCYANPEQSATTPEQNPTPVNTEQPAAPVVNFTPTSPDRPEEEEELD